MPELTYFLNRNQKGPGWTRRHGEFGAPEGNRVVWSVQPEWEISSYGPSGSFGRIGVCWDTFCWRERERESCGRKEKKRVIRRRSRFVPFFFFSFLSVDYRNCPQWILFGYRPLILLSFCWLWPLMLGSERSRVRVWMLMYSLFWVRWILFCFVRGAVLLVDTTKKKIHVGNVGGCQYNSRGVFWLLKFR